ncbi:MAG: OadG family protein [Pseudomonadota bacterium]
MDPLLSSAVQLMLLGMGSVFFFLTLLVLSMHLMSWLIAAFAPTGIEQVQATILNGGVPPEHVAAITAAIALQHGRRPNGTRQGESA